MSVGTNIQTVNFNNIQPRIQTNFRSQSSHAKDYSLDTVEINDKKKMEMSSGTKWGIGIGLAALGTVLAVALSRGKGVSSNNIKQLAEHIDFKEAKTMEEAKKYAMDNFGMKLELGEDLFTANLVNDMCTNVSNRLKGKVSFPIKSNFEAMDKGDMASYNI